MTVIESLQEPKADEGEAEAKSAPRCALDLATLSGAVSPQQLNKDVIQFFKDYPDQGSLPVVEDGIPIGIMDVTKAWGLIQRFSEDIDLVIDKGWLGIKKENDPEAAASPSQLKRRLKIVEEDLAIGRIDAVVVNSPTAAN